ncbi:MAG: Crp/Fnr family transcriptional regulator [Ottowia sp.]|uniref:Crp/Fnr family transcriptional regulator n=1 Tax=Ottowia sp. TaxID=1898956 RepID=UPI003C7277EC
MRVQRVLQSRRTALTDAERAILEQAIQTVVTLGPRETFVNQGQTVNVSALLLEGLMSRHVDDFEGYRQMVALQVPGDFVDLHGYPLKTLDHDVATLTVVRLALVPHAELWKIQEDHPALARKLWFLTLLDAAMHRKWVYRLGRLKAIARIAHFLCETSVRLAAVGLSDGKQFHLPLTQFDLGEICGMTSVHVNRVVRELREAGLCSLRNQQVDIHDWHGLAAAGAFEPGYLYLDEAMTKRFSISRPKDEDMLGTAT